MEGITDKTKSSRIFIIFLETPLPKKKKKKKKET